MVIAVCDLMSQREFRNTLASTELNIKVISQWQIQKSFETN